jgi:drug/metabolite transporter (DMT)-like permease
LERKDRIDAFGATALIAFAGLLAFNQVVIAVVNEGLQPVFFAGVRSAIALVAILIWMRLRGLRLDLRRDTWGPGLLAGMIFAAEFLCLFVALDLTTVTRVSVIFYSMPVWMALAAHVAIPGDRITPRKGLGLAIAFTGTAWAILDRSAGGGEGSLLGDLLALAAAWGWMGSALLVRITPLREVRAETQLFWYVAVSAPVLIALAPLFGPLLRDPQPVHLAGLAFQGVIVVAGGFVFWLWLLARYPASGVASFSFLTPVFSLFLGWALLGETVGPTILACAALVAVGLILINRPGQPPAPASQVPQNVAATTSSGKGARR